MGRVLRYTTQHEPALAASFLVAACRAASRPGALGTAGDPRTSWRWPRSQSSAAMCALVVGLPAPGPRSPESTLGLTTGAFIAGVPAYAAMTALPALAHRPGTATVLAERCT